MLSGIVVCVTVYALYTVEFEVSFVKSSVNTLSFTGQFKYQFSVFSCSFIYLIV